MFRTYLTWLGDMLVKIEDKGDVLKIEAEGGVVKEGDSDVMHAIVEDALA